MRGSLLIALLLAGAPSAQAACTRAWRVPFEDWRPYSFRDAAGRHTGLETELLAAVAKEVGCDVQYLLDIPRNRRLPLLAAGELDLLIAASTDGPNPGDVAWYTRPYRDEEFGAFALAGYSHLGAAHTMADLLAAKQRLLTHRGPSFAPVVDEFASRRQLTLFEDYAKGVQLLKLRRGDFLIGDRLAIAHAAEAAGVELVELPVYVSHGVVTYKLSRKAFGAADLEEVNQAILRLEARGELQRIRSRWLPQALRAKAGP